MTHDVTAPKKNKDVIRLQTPIRNDALSMYFSSRFTVVILAKEYEAAIVRNFRPAYPYRHQMVMSAERQKRWVS
jgi:hypothetical protein